MEKVIDYTTDKFLERIANGKYTALHKGGLYVGGLTLYSITDIGTISTYSNLFYLTWLVGGSVITIAFDSFEN